MLAESRHGARVGSSYAHKNKKIRPQGVLEVIRKKSSDLEVTSRSGKPSPNSATLELEVPRGPQQKLNRDLDVTSRSIKVGTRI